MHASALLLIPKPIVTAVPIYAAIAAAVIRNVMMNLTRIIHEASTAAAYMGTLPRAPEAKLQASTVPFKYACGATDRKPCIHAHPHRLATNLHE
jgi:hypothetical protein